MKNSYDSFKADAKGLVGFAAVWIFFWWVLFYPIIMMMGYKSIAEESKPEFRKRFWRAPATWLWLLCACGAVYVIFILLKADPLFRNLSR